ncbi:FAD-binding oxidoreductase [Sphingomonas sp. MMSM20]|uniref:NAD(P)/FAD-dependent oxidoreductase n=1 Tax=Sphingomonas lycopersici TaxID=2951807 RepID=UPI0022384630|nr:FAD-binding oxidoreductase [Sphingomonas lycopersici]MCW6530391.1 FAD-binding oxidoreductase [Sphingomonas lycopersici]
MSEIEGGGPFDRETIAQAKPSRRDFFKGAAAGVAMTTVAAAATTVAVAGPGAADDAMAAADMEKYRALGGWIEKPSDIRPALDGDTMADVVIIGGGFAGLSTALELRRQGANVAVIEREFCGFGASGRNAGYLAGAGGLEHDLFLKRVGDETGKKIIQYYDGAVDYVEARFKEYDIACDYVPSGVLRAAVDPSQEGRVRESMEIGHRLGHKSQFLDSAEMRARGIPPAFLFGEYDPRGGTLNPGKYVLGLRAAALRAGVRIYETTPMLSYAEGRTIKVQTPRGAVRARAMVFATNGYTPGNGLLETKVMPVRVSAIETEPLSPAQLKSLGWPRREGIVTAHYMMESHRLTASDTLVVTTKKVRYPYGSRTPNVPDYDAYHALRRALHERFPTVRGIALRTCWSGYISFAQDALPVIGVTGADQNIFYTAGCSGHGVASQSFVGHLLAQRIRGVVDPILAGIRHDTPNLLPEPLRWCTVNGAFAATNVMDERLNAKIAARSA